jgi:predicted N-formylglutamate amidohydrolase
MTDLPLVISCEHGGNEVPEEFHYLFVGNTDLVESHRGFDPGAAELAQWLGWALDCPCVIASVTRLLVDLNRSVGHGKRFSELTRPLPRGVKERISQTYYLPYRTRVEEILREVQERLGRVVHISVHSFVPELNGVVRNTELGILYDPRRVQEKKLANAWIEAMRSGPLPRRIRRNYPYRGTADGFVVALRRRLGSPYVGIEVEVNQDWPLRRRQEMPELHRAVAEGLRVALTRVFE